LDFDQVNYIFFFNFLTWIDSNPNQFDSELTCYIELDFKISGIFKKGLSLYINCTFTSNIRGGRDLCFDELAF